MHRHASRNQQEPPFTTRTRILACVRPGIRVNAWCFAHSKAGAKLSAKHGFKDLSHLSLSREAFVSKESHPPSQGLNIARPLVGDSRFGGLVRSVGERLLGLQSASSKDPFAALQG